MDEVGRRVHRRFGEFEGEPPSNHLLEQDLDLHSSEERTEAEVGATSAEGHLLACVATDVETERISEHLGVAVGGGVPHHDLVTGRNLRPRKLSVHRCSTTHVQHGSRPPDDFFDGGFHQRRIGHEPIPLTWVVCKRHRAVSDGGSRGLVAGEHQHVEEIAVLRG